MSGSTSAEFVVVGSGFSGMLTARELVRAGRDVLLVERGDLVPHAEQLARGTHEAELRSSVHNDEPAPGGRDYPWQYTYGVGGGSLKWSGVSPRFLPDDFELRSRFGVGRDWPLTYTELKPFYAEAERVLGVAGAPNPFFPGTAAYPQPAQPYAPVDRVARHPLRPYFPLPQARPTRSINGRRRCCGAAECKLCPVNARYSVLHTLEDERLERSPGFNLRTRSIAARLRVRAGKVTEVEALDERGDPVSIRGRTVILAANGIENPAILLRSGLGGPDVGRYLFDHAHHLAEFELDRSVGAGRGATLATGISYAYADGDFRAERGSLLVYPANVGASITEGLIAELAAGHSGSELRSRVTSRYERTMVLDMIGEDLPRRDRFVELSPRKDSFGLPLNRINYPADSPYLDRSLEFAYRDLQRRLRRLGAGEPTVLAAPGAQGAHSLGTCYMGERGGVVNHELRHHQIGNLYVAGGSAFPAYSAHHPSLTISALAIRLGRHLAREAPR
jgi:choline dehydrogenase-like flavoprotein